MTWRDVLQVHPAAELFPRPSPEELQALADDIKANGLLQKVVLFGGDSSVESPLDGSVVDGVTRLDACDLAGIPVIINGILNPELLGGVILDRDPYAYAVSANLHRRHLAVEDRKRLAAEVLKLNPAQSNSAVAKLTKLSDKTVDVVRNGLVSNTKSP